MMLYRARLIELGRVMSEQVFEALNYEMACNEANEGIDPYGPRWVEVSLVTDQDSAA